MDIGLLLLRAVIGALFIGHGTQKLFGWFGGPGLEGARSMLDSLGYRRPRWMAVLGGLAEAGAGLLLVLGVLTPLAAAAIIGVMLHAIVRAHLPNGLWISEGGYEYNLVLIAAATALAFTGPGAIAVDSAANLGLAGPAWGVAALAFGLVAGGVLLAARTGPQQAEAEQTEAEQPRTEEREHAMR